MRSLTDIASLSADEINAILNVKLDGRHILRTRGGGSVALMFHEPSTRTRFSFSQAVHHVGLIPVDLDPSLSSEQKGETTVDTCRNLAWAEARAIIIRTRTAGLPAEVAAAVDIPVINAGDGTNEHPSQAFGDALTLMGHFKRIRGLTIAIVGDVSMSRVARSNAYLLTKLGANVRLVSASEPRNMPASLRTDSLETGLLGADVVMILRWQDERHLPGRRAKETYHIDEDILARLAPKAMLMHPGPVNRGIEVTSDVVDGPRSLVKAQVQNGVKARMKILHHLLD